MVREFKLVNEKGQEFSLMDIHNYCLLTEPAGLGYEYSSEYEQLGNTFIDNIRQIVQGTIEGIVNFINYDNYKKLIDYIEGSEKLRLSYLIPFESGEKEYFKDIEIQSISKTQKATNTIISESIVFNCLSLWYEEKIINYSIEEIDNEIRWDFEWDSRFNEYDSRSLTFINEGHTEAPIEVEIKGHVLNPKIELYVEGQLYQTVTFNVDISQYEKLLYGTKENNFYINRRNADGTESSLFSLDVIDFANDNVIRLPQNKSCEIKISADNDVAEAKITILTYYKAV